MEKVIKFLIKNGYKEDSEKEGVYRSFFKDGMSTINVNALETVFTDGIVEWLTIPTNIYALIGALLHHRQIAFIYEC